MTDMQRQAPLYDRLFNGAKDVTNMNSSELLVHIRDLKSMVFGLFRRVEELEQRRPHKRQLGDLANSEIRVMKARVALQAISEMDSDLTNKQIATRLNARGIPAFQRGPWTPNRVNNLRQTRNPDGTWKPAEE